MFNAGAANLYIDIQNVTTTLDAQGAPIRTYASYLNCYAAVERLEYAVENSATGGPREESIKTFTMVVRNHPSLNINSRQRVVDLNSGDIYHITGIRYDAKLTTCYIDVQSGESDG